MEFFTGQGLATTASDGQGRGRRFPEPPQHGDSSMLVIRDALLSQLQKDRLRQEIIMAELAKIERAMALRSADADADARRANLASFHSSESFMPHGGAAAAARAEPGVGADEVRDLKKEDGVAHQCVEHKLEKPAMDHELAGGFFKSLCSTRDPAVQENAALDACKMQKSSETMLPKENTPSSIKWSCSICQAKATSEGNLQQHFAGQKHQSKAAALVSRKNANSQKATLTAEQARNVKQYAAEKPRPTWLCRFCQSNCTCKSDLENHLRGKKHQAKIQVLLEECRNMARTIGLAEAKSDPNNLTQDEENPTSTWNCNLCQAKCTRQSELENHLKGKRHKLYFLVLQVEAQKYLSEWGCGICQAKCKSVSQFEDHCGGRGHQQKIQALLKGGISARSSIFQAAKEPPSDVSNSKGGSQEIATQRALYFCRLCNLQCNSKNTLAEHRLGKKHTEKVEKRMSLSYCKVCNLQCNSEKMLAHHCTGKAHLAKVNGC